MNLNFKFLHLALALFTILPLAACNNQSNNTLKNSAPENSISLVAVGDIMLGGTAEEVLIENGYDYPFKQVRHLLDNADIVIGNLEGPLTDQCESPLEDKEYVFRSPPAAVSPALRSAGFNLMNLANNHILDFGIEGLTDTIDSLNKQQIKTVGTGKNLDEARTGTIYNTANGSVGFLSYSLTFPESFWATDTKAGTAFGHEAQIREDVRRLDAQADYVIVSFHWGREKSFALRPYQPVLAHAAIDVGADIVLGHHPHVLQAIEEYKDGLIIYSLGNFVFGSYSTAARTSVVARLTLHNGGYHSAEFSPINVLNAEVIFQPQPLHGDAASEVIQQINQLSKTHNTQLTQTNDKGFLHSRSNKIQSFTLNN